MAIQYLIPGGEYVNESGDQVAYLVPGGEYVNEVSPSSDITPLFTSWVE